MVTLRTDKNVEANYRRMGPKMLRRYFRRGRRAARAHTTVPQLHRFRIRTKRIRYISDLYKNLFPRALRRSVIEFQRIQDTLGAIQDQATVITYFERRLASVRTPARQAEYMRLLLRARARQEAFRQRFMRQWRRLEQTSFLKRVLKTID